MHGKMCTLPINLVITNVMIECNIISSLLYSSIHFAFKKGKHVGGGPVNMVNAI